MDLEEHNLREIEGLSQRGKTLSIVDLISANTLTVDMAAYSLNAIANGASFLTAARPGNAGKTTLLACLLTFLPPGVKIISVGNPEIVKEAYKIIGNEKPEKFCFLPHEIGAGRLYGYLWGRHVGQLMSLMNQGCRVVSCIHEDTLPELHSIMVSKELGVSEDDFNRIGLIMFMKLERELNGYRRRVLSFYEMDNHKHNLVFDWEANTDVFNRHNENKYGESEDLKKCQLFVKNLMTAGKTDFRWVRQQVAEFYNSVLRK